MATGMAVAGAATARSVSSAMLTSASADHYFSCRNKAKSALIPSCLASTPSLCPHYTAPPPRNHCTALVPSSLYSFSSPSWSHSSFVGSGDLRVLGLSVGFNGKFVRDLRQGSSSRVARFQFRSMAGQSETGLDDAIQLKNSKNAVVVYSKSWCPFCGMVKSLLNKLGVSFELVELDDLADEEDVQDALQRLTGQSTVPNVFIGGKHIGGCDDTMALHEKEKLLPLLQAAGAKIAVP